MSRILALAALGLLAGCTSRGDCADSNYGGAECREVAQNELARLTAGGTDLRFTDPRSIDSAWVPAGHFFTRGGVVHARIGYPGDFAIRVLGAEPLELVVENVDPHLQVTVGPAGAEVVAGPVDEHLSLTLQLAPTPDQPLWIRGHLPCPDRFRIAAFGDIQTGQDQARRMLDRMRVEAEAAELAGEPLLAMLVLGDLAHDGSETMMSEVAGILRDSPVAVAATAGNHDVFNEDPAMFTRYFGPSNYHFDLCNARVAMMDTGDSGLAPSAEARLEELLDRGDADFLLAGTHYPPYSAQWGNGWIREDQQSQVLAELAFQEVDLILAGHIHNLTEFTSFSVGDRDLHQVVTGTGGADQGVAKPRYGYYRVTVGETLDQCFVETPPEGQEPDPRRADEPPFCP